LLWRCRLITIRGSLLDGDDQTEDQDRQDCQLAECRILVWPLGLIAGPQPPLEAHRDTMATWPLMRPDACRVR
jgi:hypothetical protein